MTTHQDRPLPAEIETTGSAVAAYIPQTFTEAMKLATVIYKSGLAPETLKSEGAVFVAMAHGAELGLKPMQAIRLINVIKGKPTLSADGIVAVCLASGVCEYFEPVEESDKAVTWRTRRRGQEEKRLTFTLADATTAGIVSDMYKRWPKRMLSARCKAFLGRDVYPDIVGGLYTPDEATEAVRAAIDVTPEAVTTEAVPEAPKASAAAISHLMGVRDKCGLSRERDDILRELSEFCKRPITSRNDLTAEEAARYTAGLEEFLARDTTPDAGQPKGQGELAGTAPRGRP